MARVLPLLVNFGIALLGLDDIMDTRCDCTDKVMCDHCLTFENDAPDYRRATLKYHQQLEIENEQPDPLDWQRAQDASERKIYGE